MKKLILLTIILMSGINIFAQNATVSFIKGVTGIYHDRAIRIATDSDGNSVIAGLGQSPFLNFGSINITSAAGNFISKIDKNGNWLWAKPLDFRISVDLEYVKIDGALTIDNDRNIFCAGLSSFTGSIGGVAIYQNMHYLVKIDSNGNYLWAQPIQSPKDICTDAQGYVYVLGQTSTMDSSDYVNVSKFKNAGILMWEKTFPINLTNAEDNYGKIAVNSNSEVFIRGTFADFAQFPTGTMTMPFGTFLAKLDENGNTLWARADSAEDLTGTTMCIDTSDNIVIAGYYYGRIVLDTITLNSGAYAYYMAKYNADGHVLWAKNIAELPSVGPSRALIYDMNIGTDNNISICGGYRYLIDFIDTVVTGSWITTKGFLISYDEDGSFRFFKQDSGSISQATCVSSDAAGAIYTAGFFTGSTFSVDGLSFQGDANTDVFVYKSVTCDMTANTNLISNASCFGNPNGEAEVIVSGGAAPYLYQWNDITEQTTQTATGLLSGLYSVTVTDAKGCVSTNSITIEEPNFNDFSEICAVTVDPITQKNMIVWNTEQHAGIGNYYIYKETSEIGVFELIHSVSIEGSNEYIDLLSIPEQQSYLYKIAVSDSLCDIVSSNFSATHKTIHLNANIGTGGENNLIWNPYEGITVSSYQIYRSVDSDPFQLIGTVSGSNFSFTDLYPAVGTNRYYISISGLSCASSKSVSSIQSNTIQIGINSIKDINVKASISTFPNPSEGLFEIFFSGFDNKRPCNIKIFNALGQIVIESSIIYNVKVQVDLHNYPSGIYTIVVLDDSGNPYYERIVKK